MTSAPSTNARWGRKAVTRATSATRPTDWMRPMNAFVSGIFQGRSGAHHTDRRRAARAAGCAPAAPDSMPVTKAAAKHLAHHLPVTRSPAGSPVPPATATRRIRAFTPASNIVVPARAKSAVPGGTRLPDARETARGAPSGELIAHPRRLVLCLHERPLAGRGRAAPAGNRRCAGRPASGKCLRQAGRWPTIRRNLVSAGGSA